MTAARRVLLGIFVVAVIVCVAVFPESESCKSTCVGGGSATPSMIWRIVGVTSLLAVLVLRRRERHAGHA
jgi:hypothetical protein